jgi:transglutaminase-like putative cysteine protease
VTAAPRSSRLSIRHVTGFVYDGLAESSYNEARMTPLSSSRQHVLEATLRTSPVASQLTYLDYFGSAVTAFDLHERHSQLEVTAGALVEVVRAERSSASLSLEELGTASVMDRYSEYLKAGARTFLPDDLHAELAAEIRNDDVDDVVARVSSFVRDRVAYVTGSTHVTTTALESWTQKSGVCQDLSHLMISFLRGRRIPARYVSGYLHPQADPTIGETVLGQSHAWVEYFCGEWVGVDPTNGNDIGLQHVVVAKGRDYGDVPPLKGIYHGAPSRALGVTVEITKLS